ncbi:hypothetical protein DFJ77DRAFT_353991 [Powellomyces hirtus]|nr:hypothetical protein DFJ77DRAFT_353991 [Powellomyces hirtus]
MGCYDLQGRHFGLAFTRSTRAAAAAPIRALVASPLSKILELRGISIGWKREDFCPRSCCIFCYVPRKFASATKTRTSNPTTHHLKKKKRTDMGDVGAYSAVNIDELAKQSTKKEAKSWAPAIPLAILAPLLVVVALIAAVVPTSVILNEASHDSTEFLANKYMLLLLDDVRRGSLSSHVLPT